MLYLECDADTLVRSLASKATNQCLIMYTDLNFVLMMIAILPDFIHCLIFIAILIYFYFAEWVNRDWYFIDKIEVCHGYCIS